MKFVISLLAMAALAIVTSDCMAQCSTGQRSSGCNVGSGSSGSGCNVAPTAQRARPRDLSRQAAPVDTAPEVKDAFSNFNRRNADRTVSTVSRNTIVDEAPATHIQVVSIVKTATDLASEVDLQSLYAAAHRKHKSATPNVIGPQMPPLKIVSYPAIDPSAIALKLGQK